MEMILNEQINLLKIEKSEIIEQLPPLSPDKGSPRILVACEFTGMVREAFRAKGWDAWSCDLLPTEIPGQHIQGDVLEILDNDWDMMIAHPPCTYLSIVSAPFFNEEKYGEKAGKRKQKREEAINFFMKLWNAPICKIAIENPVGFINNVLKPTQIIHPYYFGDADKKRTCLWLKNLPALQYSFEDTLFEKKSIKIIPNPKGYNSRGNPYYLMGEMVRIKDAEERAKIRSKTFPGIARAMADQWAEVANGNAQPRWVTKR